MADCSYQFLSSLSPRIKPNGKNKYKGPSVLSLKHHIRRSSLIAKPRTIPNESLSIVEISSTDSASDNASRNSDSYTKSNSKSEIEASPLQNGSPSHISLSSQEEFVSPSPQKGDKSFTCLSTTKKKDIRDTLQSLVIPRKNLFGVEKWLKDVEEATTDIKTGVLEPSIMSYDDFERKSYEQIVSSTMVPVREDGCNYRNNNQVSDSDNDDGGTCNKSSENLLDDIYGSAWRLKRDEILPNSEKKIKKKILIKKHPDSERKPMKSDSFQKPCTDALKLKSKNLFENFQIQKKWVKDVKESPIVKKLRSICDEETDEESFRIENAEAETDKNSSIDKILDNSLNDDKQSNKSDLDNSSGSDKENFIDDEIVSLKDRIERKWNKTKINTREKKTPIKKLKNKKILKSAKQSEGENTAEFNCVKKLNIPSQDHFIPKIAAIASIDNRNKWRTASSSSDSDEFDAPNSVRKGGISSKKENTLSFLASLSKDVPSNKCDFSAKIYKNNFKQYKEELTKKLFDLYNEKIFGQAIPENTNLEWSGRMLRTAGYCYSKRLTHKNGLVTREVRIVLSSKVLDSADRLRDTLVHEMCHAATWIVDKVQNGHGVFWKAWASKAMKVFPELPPVKTCHNYEISTKYVYKCTGCGYSIGRHRKSLDIERKRCGYCFGKFEVFINKTSKNGDQKTVPTPKKEPTGFALFVKENYSNFRVAGKTHADVMRQLSEEFRKIKV